MNSNEIVSTPLATVARQAFVYQNGELTCDGVPLSTLAERHGTPLYVYSLAQILHHFDRIVRAFADADPLVAYSVKANSNLALLAALARRGSGFDIVSIGELERVAAIGAPPCSVIFAGVGKRRDEIRQALRFGVGEFNIESPGEAELINEEAAAHGTVAPVALRLNPDVDAHTHEYISTGRKENKFGINLEMAREIIDRIRALPNLQFAGLHAHIGSQILDPSVHSRAVTRLEEFAHSLQSDGVELTTLNMGGGFGIDYETGEQPLRVEDVAAQVLPIVKRLGVKLVLEPGRFIVASAGTLVTRTLYVKRGSVKTFLIVDGSMTDLIRPSLYAAFHRIAPVKEPTAEGLEKKSVVDVVGPVCETGDFLARDRSMPPVEPGDLLAVLDAGAYCMTMASNYNTRPRPAEILVADGKDHVVRRRETVEELLKKDIVPAFLSNGSK